MLLRIDRRDFLKQAGSAGAGVALARVPLLAQAAGVAAPLIDRGFATVTRIADGVYATIANLAKGAQALSNGGLIVGRDAVLLIEGHFQPEGAALEVEAAGAVSKAPIKAAINTHYHFDHTFGNAYYAGRQIPIIGHEQVVPLMKERYADLKGKDKAPLLAPFERKLRAAADGTEKLHAEGDLNAAKLMYSAVDAATLVYPTQLAAPGTLPRRIDLGGLTAIIETHPGHTPTDLIVRVPQRNVVFAGDLLFNEQYPVAFDANMTSWRLVLDLFIGYGPRVQFVPGHGAVCDRQGVKTLADVMDDLRAHAEQMMKAGVPLDEAQKRYVVPPPFRSFGMFAWSLTVGAAIEKYYGELRKA